ncbi:unnamed protein product [Protopolystoma xenopodis]|uniref:Uncharacterized protein n=1 Tax=Protopolystoma xenopodis TaxID=117903 RepID=A0A3S5B2G4_9PLAT|nr:unnamed protein product [Protopolystoma xenopodis]
MKCDVPFSSAFMRTLHTPRRLSHPLTPCNLVLRMLIRLPYFYAVLNLWILSLPLAPWDPSATSLVQVFRSTPATPSVLLEALFPTLKPLQHGPRFWYNLPSAN